MKIRKNGLHSFLIQNGDILKYVPIYGAGSFNIYVIAGCSYRDL